MMHAAPPQLWLGIGVFLVIWLVIVPVGLAPIFAALGAERSRAWIPFVNLAMIYRLGGFSEFWLIALVIPGPSVFGLIVLFVASHHIGRTLGRGPWWTVLAVLQWWVWALVLGLTRPQRRGTAPGGEPEIWSVQPRPQTAIAIPDDGDDSGASTAGDAGGLADAGAVADTGGSADASVSASFSAPLPTAEPPSIAESLPVVEPLAGPGTQEPMPPVESTPLEETLQRASVVPNPAPAPAPTASPAAPPAPAPTLLSDPDDDATIITNDETVITGIRGLDSGDAEATIVSPRRRKWWLTTTLGTRVELTGPSALLGRRPSPHPLYPGAQLIVVTDDARSVSATHAVLEFVNDQWQITDLDSTNGVWLVNPNTGVESELGSGKRARVTPEFLLGELGVKVVQGG